MVSEEVEIASTSQEVIASASQEVVAAESIESSVQEYHAEHYEERHKEDFELDVTITTQVQEESFVEVESEADVEAAIARGKKVYLPVISIKVVISLQGIGQLKCRRTVGTGSVAATAIISTSLRNSSNLGCCY